MSTTLEAHISELVERKAAGARVAETIGSHPTLWLGIAYVITIAAVLAFVTRF